jgi:uncharacterized membrane protein
MKKSNAEIVQYLLLGVFTLFTLYFSVSSYRLYHMKEYDLVQFTGTVESVFLKEAKGKQGKPEIWIHMGNSAKYRVAYGNNQMFHDLAGEIQKGDLLTVFLKKEQHVFIDLGNENDILQIAKEGRVIYSLEIPQKNFHVYYLLSAIMSFLLPLGCIFYWVKSKHNLMASVRGAA